MLEAQCDEATPHASHVWQEPASEFTAEFVQCPGVPEPSFQMDTNEMLDVLSRCQAKLDAGEELTPEEQAQLEAIGKYLSEVINNFVQVLQEAFAPIIESLSKTLAQLWEGLPQEVREYLSQPRRVVLGDVATPYSEAQSRVFVDPYTTPLIQQARLRNGDVIQ